MKGIVPIAALLLLAAVAGCAATPAAPTAAGGADPVADLTAAMDLYGIAKGIAQQGDAADPSLLPAVTAATAIGDDVLATARTLLRGAATDPGKAAALARMLERQAQALTLTAAPAVTVAPNQAAAF